MMKKNVFFYGALALGMAGSLASCSSDDDLMAGSVPGGNTAAAGQVIEIAVENAGNGIGSRAGRPLNSSEAKQNIDCVKVIVTNATTNKVVADTLIENWMTSTAVTNYDDASGHGRKIRFTLANSNAITTKGTYTVYAIGYNGNSAYKVKSGSSTMSLGNYLNSVGNGTYSMREGNGYTVKDAGNESIKQFKKDLVLINNNTDYAYADEVFAGSTTLDLTNDTKFSQGVTLHRQVAGIFTYVKNVPYMYTTNGNTITDEGNILQLVAVKKNKNLVLGQFYNTTLGNNGKDNILQNVVNGADEDNKEYVVYEIKLKDWFKTLQDENNDGVIDRYEYMIAAADDAEGKYHKGDLIEDKSDDHLLWHAPLRDPGQRFENVGFVKGSVFGGEFIIPFKATAAGDYTFELRLVSKKEDNVTIKKTYRTWSISLPTDDILKTTDKWSYWDGSKFTDLVNLTKGEDRAKYSVLRNHLYGVGVKSKEKPDTGDPNDPDPDDPDPDDPDPEVPEDLNTKQDLLVQVNDNWELIHKMEVE
ncbi:MAG TPA: hypothetical protein H9966_06770 [Candidatus Prevotella avicola]|uniref:Fimbrial subunit protein C-terminal domain-containing protein n=1 Tax=Candidatus Prevotella avicola TaxID=2838738 RepID=A0A9D2JXI2_9BACT|nr:hypothetical protein [Candidatus Prevotella avicola]